MIFHFVYTISEKFMEGKTEFYSAVYSADEKEILRLINGKKPNQLVAIRKFYNRKQAEKFVDKMRNFSGAEMRRYCQLYAPENYVF